MIRPALRDELPALRAKAPDADPDALVFGTTNGKRHTATNIRKRVLTRAVERAEAVTPMPEHLTPHSLRWTFASVLYAIGEDPPTVMAEMGHSSPVLALRIYAQAIRRDEGEKDRLKALVTPANADL
jgi:integrase